MKQQNRMMVETACSIAKKTHSKGVLLYADMIEDFESLAKIGQEKQTDLILAIKDQTSFQEASSVFKKVLQIPDVPLGRINQIKMAIIQALSKGLVKKGDKWVCLSGIPQAKTLDNLLILEFGREFEIISSSDLPILSEIVRPEVFETLLNLALEISTEGKEGRKPNGTIFVMGKHEDVLKYSHPMVINPFQGYPEEERNILDPRLKQTVKEFSSIDGAFIFREDGVILAAGRHLDASGENIEIPLGLGSRHRAAAGITSLTDALAIVVSEETGEVRIFHHGKIFMEIEKEE
ncbi:MAG: DNA integrity scanning protein DisA nucleotide-binding domain protein [Syntrophaceae bacterium]|nr:DNA integrity scanning protein DisA nucleotide-binding domain protein [Syntrophaceae bacterium]